ncbi:MAG: baseplate J/gp47 family protein, partial [Bacteroidia bacterium]|nr:baseplate J/gp47 family protein [Bacteroidia bacterium]
YQISFTAAAINAARSEGSTDNLPKEPYTPQISELSLNYTATVSINLISNAATNNVTAFTNRADQFFHVQPFGVAEVHPFIVKAAPFITLFPTFNDEGSLYIGVKDLSVPRNLSVLFKVAEGSADPDLPKQTVDWSFLVNNEWVTFPKGNVINDFTNGLITSGIITFTVPRTATNNNTILTTGYNWIRASVTTNARAICDMIDIRTQAVNAVFADNGNDPEHLAVSLPANTIKGLVNSESDIAKVLQPYSSFGGRKKESSEAYSVRVSERLRHKNRAIMIWDYERIVLEDFPEIYKVKCLNHTRYVSVNDIKEISPGHVSLVIVSNLQNKNAVNPLKPKTSLYTLTKIHDLVKKLNPPAAELFVKNPIYEEIVVHFNVRFLPGFDPGFYQNQLNTDIIAFLAPWAYGSTNITFGLSIHASVIINFIEEREYVDFLACFQMDQVTTTNGTLKNIEEAIPTTSASILTSAVGHFINVLETDDCECDDNEVKHIEFGTEDCPCDVEEEKKPFVFGIGTMVVADNFIVGNGLPINNDGIGSMDVGNDFEVH